MRWRLANARRLAPVIGMHVRFGRFGLGMRCLLGGCCDGVHNGRVHVCTYVDRYVCIWWQVGSPWESRRECLLLLYIHTYSEGVTYIPRALRLTGLWFEIRPKLGCEWSRDRQAPTHPSGQLPTYSICRHTYGVRPGTRLGTMPLP